MDILSHHSMSVIWGMYYVWHWWIIPQITTWPQTTPRTCSAVTLDIGTKIMKHGPHQWCSGPMMMMQVWICYPTILGVWTASDMGGSPHRLHHMTINYTPDILSCYPGYCIKEFLQLWTLSVVLRSKDDNPGMNMVSHHSISVIWGMDNGG